MCASTSDSPCCRMVPSVVMALFHVEHRAVGHRNRAGCGSAGRAEAPPVGRRPGGGTARHPGGRTPTAELASDGHRAPRAPSQPDRVVGERAGSLTEHPLGGSTWNVDVPVPPRARCPPIHDDSCRRRPFLVDRDRSAVRYETGAQRAVRAMGFGAHRPVSRESKGGARTAAGGGSGEVPRGTTWFSRRPTTDRGGSTWNVAESAGVHGSGERGSPVGHQASADPLPGSTWNEGSARRPSADPGWFHVEPPIEWRRATETRFAVAILRQHVCALRRSSSPPQE